MDPELETNGVENFSENNPTDDGNVLSRMMQMFSKSDVKTDEQLQQEEAAKLDNAVEKLFDDNVTNINFENNNDNNNDDAELPAGLQALADALSKRENSEPVDPVTEIFNNAYGDELNFAQMMQEEGDAAEIAKNMEQAVQEKFANVFKLTLEQSLQLTDQLISKKLGEFEGKFQKQNQQLTAVSKMHEEMPFTTRKEFKSMSKTLLNAALEKTSSVDDAIKIVKHLYKQTNPSLFTKPKNTRFGAPNQQRGSNTDDGSSTQQLTLENIEDFLKE